MTKTRGLSEAEAAEVHVPLLRGGWVRMCRLCAEQLPVIGAWQSPYEQGNGDGHSRYVAINLPPDSPGQGHTVTLADLCFAILVAHGLIRPPRGPYRVRVRNGDHRDLRPENLEAVPSGLSKSAKRVVADVRDRVRLAESGLDPAEVYAKRRRKALEALRRRDARDAAREAKPSHTALRAAPDECSAGGSSGEGARRRESQGRQLGRNVGAVRLHGRMPSHSDGEFPPLPPSGGRGGSRRATPAGARR